MPESNPQPPEEDVTASSALENAHGGYPALAWLMSSYPDNAIFRRFGALNLLHLLRLQAELQDMEHQLEKIREEDAESQDPTRASYAKDFRTMLDNAELGDSEQYDHLVKIGKKLHEYNSALTLALQVKRADIPTKRELKSLREWLSRPNSGNNFLVGEEAKVWEDRDRSEFVTLFPRHLENDAFTSFLGGRLLDLYHSVWGHKRRKKYDTRSGGSEVRKYSGDRITQISNVVGALLSSILPTLVILVLYFIKRMIVRIGLVILFTAVFSIALALFTAARKAEIFAATAAFAAVEVVFIGSSNSTR